MLAFVRADEYEQIESESNLRTPALPRQARSFQGESDIRTVDSAQVGRVTQKIRQNEFLARIGGHPTSCCRCEYYLMKLATSLRRVVMQKSP